MPRRSEFPPPHLKEVSPCGQQRAILNCGQQGTVLETKRAGETKTATGCGNDVTYGNLGAYETKSGGCDGANASGADGANENGSGDPSPKHTAQHLITMSLICETRSTATYLDTGGV